jgi:hypothetical protein
MPDSSQQPNQPKHEDGNASASGVDAVSSLVQPTPVRVATEQASYRHNRLARGDLHSQRPKYLFVRLATQYAALPRRSTSLSTASVTRTASGNVETNRTQRNHDATDDEHNPFHAPHLRVPRAERQHQPVGHQLRPRPPARPKRMRGAGLPRRDSATIAQRDR